MGTYSVPLRRKDSFGLQFAAYPTMKIVSDALFKSMKVKLEEIIGVQTTSRNRVIVKVIPNVFSYLMKEYEDKYLDVEKFGQFYVKNLSSSVTYVSIRNAPFEMSDETLSALLSRYGKVENIRRNMYSDGPFKGSLTGVRTAAMRLKENIPSSITIHGYTISFIYNGQLRTCFRCGSTGHMIKDCEYDSEKSMLNVEEYPEINANKGAREKESSGNNDAAAQDISETEPEPGKANDKDQEVSAPSIQVVENEEEKTNEETPVIENEDEKEEETQENSETIVSQEIGACEMKSSTTKVMVHHSMDVKEVNNEENMNVEEPEKEDDVDMEKDIESEEKEEAESIDFSLGLQLAPVMTDTSLKRGTWCSKKDVQNELRLKLTKEQTKDMNHGDASDCSEDSEDLFKNCSKKLKPC